MKKLAILLFTILSALTLSAQHKRTGSVELTEVESNGDVLTFLVEGISEKKAEVIISAKETVFYRLLYEGLEGVNDGKKLIENENKYWLTQFFSVKNAPYNAYISKIEQDGPVQKSGTEFTGRFIIILNYKALLKTLKTNGIIDHSEAVARVPKKVEQTVGLAAKKANEEAAARAKAEAEAKAKVEAEAKAAAAAALKAQKEAEAKAARYVFTKSGVGPLKAGAKYTLGSDVLNKCSLPSSYTGLYDKIECDRNQFDGSFEIRCLNGDEPALLAVCDDNDKVSSFAVLSQNCCTAEGFSIKNTASEILAGGGVDKSWKLVDGSRIHWHYVLYLNGVYFVFKDSDGVNGKVKSSAKPVALSNKNFAFLDLEFIL